LEIWANLPPSPSPPLINLHPDHQVRVLTCLPLLSCSPISGRDRLPRNERVGTSSCLPYNGCQTTLRSTSALSDPAQPHPRPDPPAHTFSGHTGQTGMDAIIPPPCSQNASSKYFNFQRPQQARVNRAFVGVFNFGFQKNLAFSQISGHTFILKVVISSHKKPSAL